MTRALTLDVEFNGEPLAESEAIVGVAVSGGRDSVALLHLLKNSGVKLVAINVEHGIRGKRSVEDSQFVQGLCEQWGVELKSFAVDAPLFAKENSYTLEQAARALRYGIFEELLDCGEVDCIALAHHSWDQSETLLMRILRGTGVRGLVGMRKVNGRYIRPLIEYSREDIDAYVLANGLEYREDETNSDTQYTRNFLRDELAKLRQRFPDLDDAFARLAASAEETEKYIDTQLPELRVYDGEVNIKTSYFANSIVAKHLIVKAADMLGVSKDIEEKHLRSVMNLAKATNGKMLCLPHGIRAHKDADGIVISRDNEARERDLPQFERLPFAALDFKREAESGILYLDADKLPKDIEIRGIREGDSICKFGGGTKSVGDFLTDKKVPKRKRDGLTVLAKGSEVFCIVGVAISLKASIDGDTKNMLKVSLQKSCNSVCNEIE